MLRYVTNNHSGIWHIRMWTKSVWSLQYFLLSWIIFDFISWSCMFSCRRSYSCCMLIAAYVYLAHVAASPRRCLNFITCLYGSNIVSCCRCRCRRRCTMWYCATLELSIYVLYIFCRGNLTMLFKTHLIDAYSDGTLVDDTLILSVVVLIRV